jgi:hypothetical protein
MPPPEGPHFVYDGAQHLFLGRRGRGPLSVAWDTNLLIDYFTYGSLLWKGESIPVDGDYGAELEGLQLILGLWVMRDIRFVILPDTIDDAKKQLSPERRGVRVQLDSAGNGGSHGPVVNSWRSTSRASLPCLAAVDR